MRPLAVGRPAPPSRHTPVARYVSAVRAGLQFKEIVRSAKVVAAALLCMILLFAAASCQNWLDPATSPSQAVSGIVYRDGRWLMLDGRPYRFIGFNAFGMEGCETGTPWTQSQLDAYFGTLPANAMTRTWAFRPWGTEPLDRIVASATSHHQKLILSLADGPSDCESDGAPPDGEGRGEHGGGKTADWYESGYRGTYLPWVRKVVARYADSPTIGMWEVMNEPGAHINVHPAVLKAFLDTAAEAIRGVDPSHLIETGTLANYASAAVDYRLVDSGPNIDVGSIHEYDYDYKTSNVIVSTHLAPALQSASKANKPLIVGETGVMSGPAGCRTSPERRASVARQKLDGYFDAGVAGVLMWNYSLAPRTSCSYDIGPNDPVVKVVTEYRVPGA
jgi:mannan endo-1,4-beta-mannosidase